MGEAKLLHHRQLAALPDRDGGRRPLADAVDGEDERPLERRGVVGARGVADVMLDEPELGGVELAAPECAERAQQRAILPALLAQPFRGSVPKRLPAAGREGEIGGREPAELQVRSLVEDHGVELVEVDPGLVEAVAHGTGGEGGVLLHAREALLLRGGEEAAVLDVGRGAVVVEGRDPENTPYRVCDAHGAFLSDAMVTVSSRVRQ